MLKPRATPWGNRDPIRFKPQRGEITSIPPPLGLVAQEARGTQGVALGFKHSAPLVLNSKCSYTLHRASFSTLRFTGLRTASPSRIRRASSAPFERISW
jgi:hypothetical protein